MKLFLVLFLAIILTSSRNVVNGRKFHQKNNPSKENCYFEYSSINCRGHSASIIDFGGIGDGKTSNTNAFKSAIDYLSQFESDGGSMLYIPPGKWLTSSFNLTTSHFTLHLHQDAVLLASQVIFVFLLISLINPMFQFLVFFLLVGYKIMWAVG